MTLHRFFIPPNQIHQETATLSGDQARQIANVLRLGVGDHIYVLDNSGWRYEIKLQSVKSTQAAGSIVNKMPESGEPTAKLTLFQSLLKHDNFEWVLQKGTELGITSFVPIVTQRTIVRQQSIKENKLARWQRIITEAAEQSGRGRIPSLSPPLSFPTALSAANENDLSLIAWENENEQHIKAVLTKSTKLPENALSSTALFIGPEGGFAEDEINEAKAAGVFAVTLGPRILRAETAAIVAAALLQHEFGQLN